MEEQSTTMTSLRTPSDPPPSLANSLTEFFIGLTITALDEAPQYSALSYVWGDPGAVASITCSGFKRKITVSLFEGLRRIRNTNDVEVAWADAICINQADNEEKSFQVNQMGDIYDKAAEVVVWLGHDVDGAAEVAFQGLRQVNKLLRDGTDTVWSPVSTEEVDIVIRESDPFKMFGPTMVRRSILPTILDLDMSNAIKKIYQLPWLTRLWILQEVGLATIATAFWGSSHVDFGEIGEFIYFAMVYKNLQDILRQDIKDIISGSPYYAFHNVWSTYDKQNSWIDFVLVLEASRKLNATDCLDHVFAFLGHPKALQPCTDKTLIQADYSTDLETLHHSLASKLAEASLNFLVQVQNLAEDLEPKNAKPSWIPQWHIDKPEAPNAFWGAWDTSLLASIPLTAKDVASASSNTLKVSSLLFDTVGAINRTMKKSAFQHSTRGCADLIEECWDLAAQCKNTYREHFLMAFAATLWCYDRTRAKTESERELRDLAHSLLDYCGAMKPGMLESRIQTKMLARPMADLSHHQFVPRNIKWANIIPGVTSS
ncbi:hypothetical protein LA080_006359 [Diaporthe eres]|nr:hypothetical protein LA080_006359 [Diaporthe eres]